MNQDYFAGMTRGRTEERERITKHDPADYECACEDCLDEQVDRLNEMLIQKAVLDDRQRILNSMKDNIDNVQTLCGIIDDPAKCMRVLEFMANLIKGEQK